MCLSVPDQKPFVLSFHPKTSYSYWPISLLSFTANPLGRLVCIDGFCVLTCSLFYLLEFDFHPSACQRGSCQCHLCSCHIQCPLLLLFLFWRNFFRRIPHSTSFFSQNIVFSWFLSHDTLLITSISSTAASQSISGYLLWRWTLFLGPCLYFTHNLFLSDYYGLNCVPPKIHMLKWSPVWLHLEIGSLVSNTLFGFLLSAPLGQKRP